MVSHEKNKFMTANSNSKLRSYHSSKLLAFEIFQSEMLSFDNSESSLSLLVVGHSIHFLNGPFFYIFKTKYLCAWQKDCKRQSSFCGITRDLTPYLLNTLFARHCLFVDSWTPWEVHFHVCGWSINFLSVL